MVRTTQESDRKKREEKWQTYWCCCDQQRARRMVQASAEKLECTGPAEKEKVVLMLQREQLASMPEPLLPKRALQEDLQSPGFTPSLAKPEIEKEVGRRSAR